MSPSSSQDMLPHCITFLKTTPLFENLNESDLTVLASDFCLREYVKGEIIFHQGDTSREIYLILSGMVRIFKTSEDGNETSINLFGSGDVFGEFATLDQHPRSAAARTVRPTRLLQMQADTFMAHLATKPNLALAMNRLLVDKLRWTAAYAEATAQYDATRRLLHILLLYKQKFGRELKPNHKYELNLGLNKTDLASLVGANREWISRLLSKWRRQGLLEVDNGVITILDLPRMEATICVRE